VIVWINGAFGSGKTTAAYELHRRLPGSFVFDPEEAGFYIRKRLPAALRESDFQDYPMWRTINRDMLAYLEARYDGPILVPMTLTNEDYMRELVGFLREAGVRVDHYALIASRETLLKRLKSRGEGTRSWAAQQIDRCIASLSKPAFERQIDTNDLSADEVVERMAALSGLELAPDRRGPIARRWDRFKTQLRHIRFIR